MDYDDLKREFPHLIPADFQFECGPGWIGPVREFFRTVHQWLPRYTRLVTWRQLNEHDIAGTRPLGRFWTLKQVKEKFGTLRIYCSAGGAVVDETIEAIAAAEELAEARAMHTCEVCGQPGMLRRGSYMRTLRDEHAVEALKTKPKPRIEGTYRRKAGDGFWYKYDPLLDQMVPSDPPEGGSRPMGKGELRKQLEVDAADGYPDPTTSAERVLAFVDQQHEPGRKHSLEIWAVQAGVEIALTRVARGKSDLSKEMITDMLWLESGWLDDLHAILVEEDL